MQKIIPKRVLGIDYGMSRIGLAISDERQIIAMPLRVVKAEKRSQETIKNLLEALGEISLTYQCEIIEIIIGLPLMMSGKVGFQADEVKNFICLFSEKSPIPVKTWDERLTTVQAERALSESSLSRKKRSKLVDTVSATIILQSYLDTKQFFL